MPQPNSPTRFRLTAGALRQRHAQARARRAAWERHWQQCYDFVLPQRDSFLVPVQPGESRADRLFDGTAPDAAEQLAASLLANLTPPWSAWFGLVPGTDMEAAERAQFGPVLDRASTIVLAHFDRSNFAVELHQACLDLVVGGTACLLFEEAPPGELSAFRFTAVPLSTVMLEEGAQGRLDVVLRRLDLTGAQVQARFPGLQPPREVARRLQADPQARARLLEGVIPQPDGGFAYGLAWDEADGEDDDTLLVEGRHADSPFIAFRWMKAPGESYGRSPVMKALPDIKTANKVVELVLKNASIAVTGIWQADDDGVLNPATVQLVPGAIIPKAVGSAGLKPLEAPGRFDVSQLVLDDLRGRIRKALLVDQLGIVGAQRMTATEVLERSGEMARVLGATYGRLQAELVMPLLARALSILARRGEIPELHLDGRSVDVSHRSPLAQAQRQRDVQTILRWIEAVQAMGPEAQPALDAAAAARWLGRALGVPAELMREDLALPADLSSPAPMQAVGALDNG
jgi:hypothetical protein